MYLAPRVAQEPTYMPSQPLRERGSVAATVLQCYQVSQASMMEQQEQLTIFFPLAILQLDVKLDRMSYPASCHGLGPYPGKAARGLWPNGEASQKVVESKW